MFTNVHGAIGKLSAYTGRIGILMRIKKKGKNPQTVYQTARRANLKLFSQLWQTLSNVDQVSWNTFAKNYTYSDKISNKYHRSGFATFIGQNCEKQLYSPGSSHIMSPSTPIPAINNGDLANIFTALLPLPTSLLIDIPIVSANNIMALWATPLMSAGRFYWKGKSSPIHMFPAGPAQPALECISFYTGRFSTPVTDKKLAFKNSYFEITSSSSPLFGAELSGKVK